MLLQFRLLKKTILKWIKVNYLFKVVMSVPLKKSACLPAPWLFKNINLKRVKTNDDFEVAMGVNWRNCLVSKSTVRFHLSLNLRGCN